MVKSIIKEIIIGLLLCLAILLILAVLLYAYVPNNKVVPEAVAYVAPEEIQDVLLETEVDTSQVILTYEVNSSDLNTAEKSNNYNPGKVNPFSAYEEVQITDAQTDSDSNNETDDNTDTDNTNGTDDEDTYYIEKGSK